MAAAATAAPPRAASRPGWIIGPLVDLSLVIGSAAAGYLYLLLYAVLHVPITYLWWFWSVGFDGTHIFGTASRTFFDREARARHGRLFYGSLLFFFGLGPAMVLAGLKGWLYLLVGAWAYYHVIRQHYGFMVLYKVKNHDLSPLDNKLDRLFLGVTLVLPPFHRFFIHHPQELGIPFSFTRAETPMWVLLAVTVALYLARQTQRYRSGVPVDLPKLLLFAAVIPLHWLTFAYMSWQAAVPTVTIVHNLQYHALVWFHNRNRYGGRKGHGLIPSAVSRSLLVYAAVALVFSALYRIPGFELGRVSDLAFGLFSGFGLTHYYLDSRIWRVRHDPGLREALQLG
ncbi:conserved membrane hypothetical protein [Candidatus Sulfopaludibacter sp. SbA3]|nr:conserved membrane hypothetical protein [Candidatus Sulfopaludibacter sp. SbA3]